MGQEKIIQILDFTVLIGLFVESCALGKLVMENVSDTWNAFNSPTLGVLAFGGFIWWRSRRSMIKKWEDRGM